MRCVVWRPLLAGLVMFVGSLAGCTDASVETTQEPAPGPVTIGDPKDYSYLDADTPPVGHIHDYWNGATELLVLEASLAPLVVAWEPYPLAVFEPDDGDVVPQGAAHVVVNVTWSDAYAASVGEARLHVRSAADPEPVDLGTIEPGVPFRIESSNAMNDLPHQLISAWRFEVEIQPRPPSGISVFLGTVSMEVTAHRGLEIPVFPPHPEPWNGTDTLVLLDDARFGTDFHGRVPFFGVCPTRCLETFVMEDGRIVPYDADHVEVKVRYSDAVGAPLTLSYRSADSRSWDEAAADHMGDDTWVHRIPIEPGMGDGPYALQSLWMFDLYLPDDLPVGVYSGEHSVHVTAHRAP